MNNYIGEMREIKSILSIGDDRDDNYDVSVVIPTYMRTDDLRRALESTLNQVVDLKYEVVICDNTEDSNVLKKTFEMIKSYESDFIRYYVNEKNIGMFNNWNRGIELAKAPYVVLLHTDDWLGPNYLSTVYDIVVSHNMDWLSVRPYGKLFSELPDNIIVPVSHKLSTTGGFFPIQCSIFKKDAFMGSGGFSSESFIDDLKFKKIFSYRYKVFQLNKELYYSGSNEKSVSSNIDWETELVFEYYYDMTSIGWRKGVMKFIYRIIEKYLILDRIEQINSGDSYFNNKTLISKDSVGKRCNFSVEKDSKKKRRLAVAFKNIDYRYNIYCSKKKYIDYA